MECRECKVKIPGENGKQFFGEIGVDGVECEPCAVKRYKKENPYWNVETAMKSCINFDCKS